MNGVALGQPDARLQIRRTVAGADRQHPLDAGRARALDDRVAIVVELRRRRDGSGKSTSSITLLQPRADRHVFEERRQHRRAAFERRRHDHALGLDAAQLARLPGWRRSPPCGRSAAPACRPWRCRRRWCAASLRRCPPSGAAACRRPSPRSAVSTWPTRRSTLTKSSIVIVGRGRQTPSGRTHGSPEPPPAHPSAQQRVLPVDFQLVQLLHLLDRRCRVDAREHAATSPIAWPAANWPQAS